MKLLIKNGRVIDPASGKDEILDILIDKGKIIDLKPRIKDDNAHTLDIPGKVIAPGFIDMHVHLREPGQEYKETIRTGTQAAARGGFTSIACMPNTSPVNDSRNVTEFILNEASKKAPVNVFPIAAVTRGLQGEEITDMVDLIDSGAIAFSDDGQPVSNSQIMRRAMEYAKISQSLIIDHCEDKELSADGVMHEGYYSNILGLNGIPSSSEEVMIARDILLAEYLEARIHIAHISTKRSVSLVKAAKKRKVRITAEVTPHHILLTDKDLQTYDTNFKMKPPLRSEEDKKAILAAVLDGTIDVFATDHAPHTPDEKEIEFDYAPFGIIGLETAVPLLLDRLVNPGLISLQRFVEMMSLNPATILGLKNKGKIDIGADADLTVLNLSTNHTIDSSSFFSKSRNTPFNGWAVNGIPEITIVSGKIVHKVKI